MDAKGSADVNVWICEVDRIGPIVWIDDAVIDKQVAVDWDLKGFECAIGLSKSALEPVEMCVCVKDC